MHHFQCKGIFQSKRHIILASASPRRRDLLKSTGIDFDVMESEIKELPPLENECPRSYCVKNASMKSLVVSEKFPDSLVLGADTVVFNENTIIGKPSSPNEALETLKKLRGKWHEVFTGCAISENNRIIESWFTKTDVLIGYFTDDILISYVNTGEPLDKAGSYGIQGLGIFFVKDIRGSYSNVVGLPLYETIQSLLSINAISPFSDIKK